MENTTVGCYQQWSCIGWEEWERIGHVGKGFFLIFLFNILIFKRKLLSLFSCSVISDSVTPRTAAYQAPLSITISQNLLKLMSIELVMPSNHLILYCPLLLLLSIFPSIRVFSNEWTFHIQSIGASASAHKRKYEYIICVIWNLF